MKLNPTARNAEQALLGGLISEPRRIGEVIPLVAPSDFLSPDHEALYRLILALHRESAVDLVTVTDRMIALGAERFGGIGYVVDLPTHCPSAAALGHYATIVRDTAIRRRLMALGAELTDRASSSLDVADILRSASEALASAQAGTVSVHLLDDVLDEVVDHVQAVSEGRTAPGLSTGFEALDAQLGGGFRPGELTILAARPAMGKTALAMNIAIRVARDACVGMFSMEMPRQQLVTRLLPMVSEVPLDRVIRATLLTTDEWERIGDGRDALRGMQLLIDDTPGLAVGQLAVRARAMAARGAELIVIDYLGKLRVEGRNLAQEVGRNVSALKDLARELKIPVVCLAQLNRGVEQRADKRPGMADLRDSGEVEQEADSVLFVYRPHYYDESESATELQILVGKARMGRLGTVVLHWDGALQTVTDCAPMLREVGRG